MTSVKHDSLCRRLTQARCGLLFRSAPCALRRGDTRRVNATLTDADYVRRRLRAFGQAVETKTPQSAECVTRVPFFSNSVGAAGFEPATP